MGEVYKAFDPTLQRLVALKVVRPGTERADSLDRLRREAQACARLEHNNIVIVHETGEYRGGVYIAMQYLAGASLDVLLDRQALSFEQKIGVLVQVLSALQHAHDVGVIHRDIKPSNVHVLPDGTVKLLDFGLARVQRAETLTLGGTIMGTVHYASPEQLRGERVDHRSDIYSTGALAYEMLTGRRPFEGDSVVTVVTKVLNETPPLLDTVWTRRFPGIAEIVMRAMAKLPDDRQQSAQEMCQALSTFLNAHRDDITRARIDFSEASQRTVVMAKELAATGRANDADTLLMNALRDDPDATEVRTVLDESVARRMMPLSIPSFATEPAQTGGMSQKTHVAAAGFIRDDAAYAMTRTWAMPTALIAVIVLGAVLLFQPWARTEEPPRPVVEDVPGSVRADGSPPQPVPPSAATAAPTVSSADTASANTPAPSVTTPPATPKATPAGMDSPGAVEPPKVAEPPTPSPASTAKELFDAGESGAAVNAGLKYRVIQELAPGDLRDADPDTTFRAGDRVKFAFESNVDGFLYVVAQGSSGRWDVLFPTPEMNGGSNRVSRSQEYEVPGDGWFAFDNNPGVEQIFVIVSKEPLGQLPGFNTPLTKPESVRASIVQDLQRSIRPRDLLYQKDKPTAITGRTTQSNYVVNRDELGKSVTATIALRHGQ